MTKQKQTLDFSRPSLLTGVAVAALALACDGPASKESVEVDVKVEEVVATVTAEVLSEATMDAATSEATMDAPSLKAADAEGKAADLRRTSIRIVGSGEADVVYVDGVRVDRAEAERGRPLVYVDGVRVDHEAEAERAQPLLYVDGIRVDHGGANRQEVMDALDPSTIARVEVLKGPAAVKLYGDEGSNGVIQIFLHEEEDADVVRRALGSVLSGIGEGISRTGEGIKKAGERLRKK